MKNKVWLLIIFLFSFMQKGEGFTYHHYNSEFSRWEDGNINLIGEPQKEYIISPDVKSYELNSAFYFPFSDKDIYFGIGIKPSLYNDKGRQHIKFFDYGDYDNTRGKDYKISE